ncbi:MULTISPECIES: COG4315 family predicted lipoprotein [unclassified Variovorax]|uniref:COG4315 family predicted lipoprotein n=1 Tax=unclassified Variovorax TaxID=663243 RepID=UPI003F468D5A
MSPFSRSLRPLLSHASSAVLLGALLALPAFAEPKPADGALVGANGMTLYTFDKDTAGNGKSVCNGGCATNWPPFMAAEGDKAAGDFTVVTRDDGKKQWAAKGWPLYYWVKDTKPGDKTGDGVNGTWKTAKP